MKADPREIDRSIGWTTLRSRFRAGFFFFHTHHSIERDEIEGLALEGEFPYTKDAKHSIPGSELARQVSVGLSF